jgi:hypothetical protein
MSEAIMLLLTQEAPMKPSPYKQAVIDFAQLAIKANETDLLEQALTALQEEGLEEAPQTLKIIDLLFK